MTIYFPGEPVPAPKGASPQAANKGKNKELAKERENPSQMRKDNSHQSGLGRNHLQLIRPHAKAEVKGQARGI